MWQGREEQVRLHQYSASTALATSYSSTYYQLNKIHIVYFVCVRSKVSEVPVVPEISGESEVYKNRPEYVKILKNLITRNFMKHKILLCVWHEGPN